MPMSTITVPPELQALLGHLTERTEIRDARGEPLGVFVPRAVAEAERFERLKALFDLKEAERSLAAERDKGRPLRDILQELKAGLSAG
jgi:hypothetical protein